MDKGFVFVASGSVVTCVPNTDIEKLISLLRYVPIPAGLWLITEISLPSAPIAPPIAT